MQRWLWLALALLALGAACTTPQAASGNNPNPTATPSPDDNDGDEDPDGDDPDLDPRLQFTEDQRDAAFAGAQLEDTAEPGLLHLNHGLDLVFHPTVNPEDKTFSAKVVWVKEGKTLATQDITAAFTPPANYDYVTGAVGLWELDGKPYVELIAVFEAGADILTVQEAAALYAWPQDPTPGSFPSPAWRGAAGNHANNFDRCFSGQETEYRLANGMLEVVLTGYAEWTDQEEDQGRDPNDDFTKQLARMKQECVKPADQTQQHPLQ